MGPTRLLLGLVLVLHVLVALFLIAVILLQGGRGGLGEALGGAAAQSLFGGSANTVMTKLTAACAGLFMLTCVSLAALSTAQGRSVIEQLPASPGELPAGLPIPQASEPPAHGSSQTPQPLAAPAPPAEPSR